jgi:SAM-dependent methyltransferase
LTNKPINYSNLSALYYHYDLPCAPQEELDFYGSFMNDNDLIHEPMCGSGNFLLAFRKIGLNISGSDASQDMLDILKQKAVNQNISIETFKAKLQEIPGNCLYTLIFIPSGSFGLITDLADILLSLKKIYKLLKDGGRFVFEVETTFAQPTTTNTWYSNTAQIDENTTITRFTFPLEFSPSIANIECRYLLSRNNKPIAAENEMFMLRLYEKKEMESLLLASGFKSVKSCSAYNISKEPEAEASTIVFICTK